MENKRNPFLEALLKGDESKSKPEPSPNPLIMLSKLISTPPSLKPQPPIVNNISAHTPPQIKPSIIPQYSYPLKTADQAKIIDVWGKGIPIPGRDPAVMRYDCEGSIMLFSEHGNCSSEFGWEIDHIIPLAANGHNDITNLQPLQWRNNRRKGDKPPTPISPSPRPIRWR